MTNLKAIPTPSTAPADLAGIAMTPADHTTLRGWVSEVRGWTVVIEPAPDRYEELAYVYRPVSRREAREVDGMGLAGAMGAVVLVCMVFRDASTGDAVVHDVMGSEVARGDDMAEALGGFLRT
jgi:hypothetical protein